MSKLRPFIEIDKQHFQMYAQQLMDFLDELEKAKAVGVNLPHLVDEVNRIGAIIAGMMHEYFDKPSTMQGG